MKPVTTPNINQMLALPFKKEPVESRDKFLGSWSGAKEYVRKSSGGSGTYQENKIKRMSEEFEWPASKKHFLE